jgi:hypothetical protein
VRVPGAAESLLADAWLLTAEPALTRGRRRSMRAWALGAVAAGVVVAGCTGSSSQPPTPKPSPSASTRTVELLPGSSVQIPSSWYTAEPAGIVGTVVYELLFVGSAKLEESCPPLTPAGKTCVRGVYEPVSPPSDGVVMLWVETQFDSGPGVDRMPGRAVVVDHYPAKVRTVAPAPPCFPGTAKEFTAAVAIDPKEPGVRMQLTACFGPRASAQVHREVQTMLESLRVQPFKN